MDWHRALEIAEEAHRGQKRRNGEPYIEHPRRVVDMLKYPEDKALAALHDVIEDTKMSYDQLKGRNVPDSILMGLIQISRRERETYYDYILRVAAGNHSTIRVKLADLIDNMSDLEEGSMKDKYRFAKHILSIVPDMGRA